MARIQCDNVDALRAEVERLTKENGNLRYVNQDYRRLASEQLSEISALKYWRSQTQPDNTDALHDRVIKEINELYGEGLMIGGLYSAK